MRFSNCSLWRCQ